MEPMYDEQGNDRRPIAAYDEGAAAGDRGDSRSQCPYTGYLEQCWQDGWYDASSTGGYERWKTQH